MNLITCSARLSAFGIIRQSSPATTRTHKPTCGPSSTIPSAGSGRLKLKPHVGGWAKGESKGGGFVVLKPRTPKADIRLFKDDRLLRFKPQLAIEDHRGES